MATHTRRELWISRLCTFATLAAFAGLFHFLYQRGHAEYLGHHTHALIRTVLFGLAMLFTLYGNLLYQICLSGFYARKSRHVPEGRAGIEAIYGRKAPSLSILVPSYKEEHGVVWQTLVSAALAEYPQKDIVLLIDDPIAPKSVEDQQALAATRLIPVSLQKRFAAPHARYQAELDAFLARMEEGKAHACVEINRLSILFEEAAVWLDRLAVEFTGPRTEQMLSHIDRFFVDRVIGDPARLHHERARMLRAEVGAGMMTLEDIRLQYQRLSGLFNVRFSSFERKKYANLSHEANKAMNLNSYISLMGRSWKQVESRDGLILQECGLNEADFTIAATDLVNTIDADSIMLNDYALRLVHIMMQPGNERVAVIQSPCSTFPGAASVLERAANVFVDMQYQTHQGMSHWNATFWVGANAMLRFTALQDIRETREENGNTVAVYIQDRTVIEDTESTVDLVHRGWSLYNYPERLTYSPTPPDFGSLLIQRRRWANGHMIILPKLLNYAWHAPKSLTLFKELFLRLHYLISSVTGCLMVLLFCGFTFGGDAASIWLPLSGLPFMLLYIRDMRNVGYKYSDFFRVYALNLMLLPIIAGGVLKSVEQVVTGKKSPFGRTPKVPGRTAAPALYSIIEVAAPIACFTVAGIDVHAHHWMRAALAFTNGAFFLYALVFFMGLRETAQDISVGVKAGWVDLSAKVENFFAPSRVLPVAAKLQRS